LSHSLNELIWLFIIYAFLGWCLEVVYATVHTGKFINRGFLNGPYCPIYGFGMIIVLLILEPFKINIPILFVGSVLLTSLLEFITGYVLERIFNQKWWDYTDEPYNLNGYICLGQSLVWGVACVFVIYVVQPFVDALIHLASGGVGEIIKIVICSAILSDVLVTIFALLKVKRAFRILSEIGEKIKGLSDMVGQNISNNTKSAMKAGDKNLQELETLRKKYQAIIDKKTYGYRRIIKAFPKLRSIIKKP